MGSRMGRQRHTVSKKEKEGKQKAWGLGREMHSSCCATQLNVREAGRAYLNTRKNRRRQARARSACKKKKKKKKKRGCGSTNWVKKRNRGVTQPTHKGGGGWV